MTTSTPLRALFERHGLTQVKVAGEVGISQAFLSQIMSGDRRPSLEVSLRLAEVLSRFVGRSVTVEDLFGEVRPRGLLRSWWARAAAVLRRNP